jgi:hypothetical protein
MAFLDPNLKLSNLLFQFQLELQLKRLPYLHPIEPKMNHLSTTDILLLIGFTT